MLSTRVEDFPLEGKYPLLDLMGFPWSSVSIMGTGDALSEC